MNNQKNQTIGRICLTTGFLCLIYTLLLLPAVGVALQRNQLDIFSQPVSEDLIRVQLGLGYQITNHLLFLASGALINLGLGLNQTNKNT